MTAQVVDPRIERRIAARRRIHRERPGRDRGGEYILSGKQPAKSQRSGYLRAVEERETLLGPMFDRPATPPPPTPKQARRQFPSGRRAAAGPSGHLEGVRGQSRRA